MIEKPSIEEVLATCHSKDLFVTECKDGPTWNTSHSRMDCWAMARSWSNPRTVGYEIKRSRRDFEQDNKWQNYLPLCNELFFVCPKGLLKAEEMPGDVGLKYVAGKSVRIIKKATYRNVEIPDSLYRYVLMCRTRIVDPNHFDPETRAQKLVRWRQWLKETTEAEKLGYDISRRVAELVTKIKQENNRLKDENERLQSVRQIIESLGVQIWRYDTEQTISSKIKKAMDEIPAEFFEILDSLDRTIKQTRSRFENLNHRSSAPTPCPQSTKPNVT